MDSYKLVENKKRELQPLYNRMDADEKKIYGENYKLKIIDDSGVEQVVPDSQSITMNDEALAVNTVQSWVLASVWQTMVEGDISDKDKSNLEDFIELSNEESEEIAQDTGGENWFQFVAEHILTRGWIANRCLWQELNGKTYWQRIPVDVRYFAWEWGNDGLEWAANTMFKTPSQIKREKYGNKREIPDKKVMETVEFWDKKKCEVWVNGTQWDEYENGTGCVPFNIVAAPEGVIHLGEDYIQHKGESLLFLTRDISKYKNMLKSIDLTMAVRSLLQPLQIEAPPEGGEAPQPKSGQTITRPPGSKKYELVPLSDVNMANRQITTDVDDAMTKGLINDADLGNWKSPNPQSSLVITEQAEIRQRIQSPRLKGIELLSGMNERMKARQMIHLEYEMDVGRRGKTKHFSYKDLGDPDKYSITFRLMSTSKKHELVNVAVAQSYKGIIPEKSIYRDVLKFDKPEYIIAQLNKERARAENPLLAKIDQVFSIIDLADKEIDREEKEKLYVEAYLLSKEAAVMSRQRTDPAFQQEQPKPQDKNNNMLLQTIGPKLGGF